MKTTGENKKTKRRLKFPEKKPNNLNILRIPESSVQFICVRKKNKVKTNTAFQEKSFTSTLQHGGGSVID